MHGGDEREERKEGRGRAYQELTKYQESGMDAHRHHLVIINLYHFFFIRVGRTNNQFFGPGSSELHSLHGIAKRGSCIKSHL